MAIAVHSSGQAFDSTGFSESITIPNDPTAFLAVGLITNRTLDHSLFNSVSNEYQDTIDNSGTFYIMLGWRNLTPGAHTLDIGFSSVSAAQKVLFWVVFTGVSQSIPLGNTATETASANTISTDITNLYNNSMTLEFEGVEIGGAVLTAINQDSSQTEQQELKGANYSIAAATKAFSSPGVKTLDWSWSGVGTTFMAHIIWEMADTNDIGGGNFIPLL